MEIKDYTNEAVELLQRLIATPSVSREESAAADFLADFIGKCGLPVKRIGNRITGTDSHVFSFLKVKKVGVRVNDHFLRPQ